MRAGGGLSTFQSRNPDDSFDRDREHAARHDAEAQPFAGDYVERLEPSDLADEMSEAELAAWRRRYAARMAGLTR